ncbi:uncharacterized protein LOC114879279 [Osmia bicornis bicornis]|uniref:uncharacterized protein LOC114879279 n=1 Tax=Osmia bicornis bicornis TaxID=1437191 RepID=UPI0010F6F5B6|nr:uncharacterized protein LOC114879279 [Osmia bicornis bicornis]
MENIKKWEEILEEILQCCVCLEIPNTTISMCTIGHHICDFCRRKLQECPLCKGAFIPARNLLAEDLISHIKDIKISIGKEIIEKLQEQSKCEQQLADAYTQTCQSTVDKKSFSVQTDTITDNEQKNYTTKVVVFYPCLIGSCLLKLSYRRLLQHLNDRHKDMFYELQVNQKSQVFSENFMIDIDKLPKDYDYAFHIHNMGLFFIKITIHENGRLIANLQIVDKINATIFYQYRLIVTNGAFFLRRNGMVTSCLVEKEVADHNGVMMHEREMSTLIKNKSFECTLIIKKCVSAKNNR